LKYFLLNRIVAAQECDATGDEQSDEVGLIKILHQKIETMVNGLSVDCDYKTTIKNDKDV
jgi:hypothetical protein